MQIVIETKDDCAEGVKLNCTPVEWLIINKALRQFVNNEDNHPDDIVKAQSMLDIKVNFVEVEGNADTDFAKDLTIYWRVV